MKKILVVTALLFITFALYASQGPNYFKGTWVNENGEIWEVIPINDGNEGLIKVTTKDGEITIYGWEYRHETFFIQKYHKIWKAYYIMKISDNKCRFGMAHDANDFQILIRKK